jgi:hypothetical protein
MLCGRGFKKATAHHLPKQKREKPPAPANDLKMEADGSYLPPQKLF